MAAFTLVKPLAGISGHNLYFLMRAGWAGNLGVQFHRLFVGQVTGRAGHIVSFVKIKVDARREQ